MNKLNFYNHKTYNVNLLKNAKTGYFNSQDNQLKSQFSHAYRTIFIPYVFDIFILNFKINQYTYSCGICDNNMNLIEPYGNLVTPSQDNSNKRYIIKSEKDLLTLKNENYYFFFTIYRYGNEYSEVTVYTNNVTVYNNIDEYIPVNDKFLTTNIKVNDIINGQLTENCFLEKRYTLDNTTWKTGYYTLFIDLDILKDVYEVKLNYFINSTFVMYYCDENLNFNLNMNEKSFIIRFTNSIENNIIDFGDIILPNLENSNAKYLAIIINPNDLYDHSITFIHKINTKILILNQKEEKYLQKIYSDSYQNSNGTQLFSYRAKNYKSVTFPCEGIKKIELTNPIPAQYTAAYAFYDKFNNYISGPSAGANTIIDELQVDVPDNAYLLKTDYNYSTNGLNTGAKARIISYKDKNIYFNISNNNPIFGKKIVWYGTSIPAGGYFGYNGVRSYPQRVGTILGAYVQNEAVGSSACHCKSPSRISEANPYGFGSGYEAVSRCLGNTTEEATWIADHYDSDIWSSGKLSSMSSDKRAEILSCSYETKIDMYLTEDTCPDIFVFDHGHNDAMSDFVNYKNTSLYPNLYDILPKNIYNNAYQHNGIISSGQRVEIDVTNYDALLVECYVSQWFDKYNLLDNSGNIITPTDTMASVADNYAFTVDVTNAAKLVLLYSDAHEIKIYDNSDYGMDSYSFNGRMNFFINRILEFNPKATIVMIGNYSDQIRQGKNVVYYQKMVADDWNIPFFDLSEHMNWHNKDIKSKGGWTNGVWDPNKYAEPIIQPFINYIAPDALHPHTDLSAKTNERIATLIANWMRYNVVCW